MQGRGFLTSDTSENHHRCRPIYAEEANQTTKSKAPGKPATLAGVGGHLLGKHRKALILVGPEQPLKLGVAALH